MTQALMAIVHQNAGLEEALRILINPRTAKDTATAENVL